MPGSPCGRTGRVRGCAGPEAWLTAVRGDPTTRGKGCLTLPLLLNTCPPVIIRNNSLKSAI